MRIPKSRVPVHPGEVLAEEFMRPLELSQTKLAQLLGVPFQRINRVVRKKQVVTIDTALRLARLFGTTPEFWLNLQHAWDLFSAQHSEQAERIRREVRPLGAR